MTEPADEGGDTAESDLAYVQDKAATLVVGITNFEPMDQNESGEWIGFDADMAKAFAESLGVTWSSRRSSGERARSWSVDGKTIGRRLNAYTNNESRDPDGRGPLRHGVPNAYCNNAQVVVLPAAEAENYPDAASMAEGSSFAVESGSAGGRGLLAIENGFNYTPVIDQATAVLRGELPGRVLPGCHHRQPSWICFGHGGRASRTN